LVYCPKCGTKNEDDAKFCVQCGAPLYEKEGLERRAEEGYLGPRERRPAEECFGLPSGGAIAGLIFGIFIILIGLSVAAGQDIGPLIGPFVLLVVGLLIVASVLYRLRRRWY